MLSDQKELFDLPEEITYLNGAYMSPQLKSVTAVGLEALRRKSRPYEISSEDFFKDRNLLKKRFAELIDLDHPECVAIIPAASYGIANVANNCSLNSGDDIVVVDEQFPSNMYSWKRLADTTGASVKVVLPPKIGENRGPQWNKAILEAITSKTAVVAIGGVHWADGTYFDLAAIREKTRKTGAFLVIDGTQSIGALPFSVKEIQPDALICAGYKWLMGPYSLGAAYYGEAFINGIPIEESWLNRQHSENFKGLTRYQETYQPGAERFSGGESSNFVLVPMLTKGIEQVLKWGPAQIQLYCSSITDEAISKLTSRGYFIEKKEHRAAHLFGVYLPQDKDLAAIKARLLEKKIMVSYRGNAIRVSVNTYNTKEDLDRLASCFN